MSEQTPGTGKALGLTAAGIFLLAAGAAGGWVWQSRQGDPASGMAAGDRAAIEKVVREYILNHPEVLPEAMANLQKRENAKQLAGVEDELSKPFPGAVMGNPNGKITLVEFTDYACTYCRQSVADVEALIAENPELRVVVREFPILSPDSADAARWALAAAEQGRYSAFHNAMFAAGRPDAATIEAAAKAAGMDLARARQVIADPKVSAEIDRNAGFARELGFNGTPSWVVGDQMLSGAVGKDELAKAIAAAGG